MNLKERLMYWLAPEADERIVRAIDGSNLRVVHIVGLLISIVETIALVIYAAVNFRRIGEPVIIDSLLRVFCFVIFSMAMFFISDRLLAPDGGPKISHAALNWILSAYFLVCLVWGMTVSVTHYKRDDQMITFYAVLLCLVTFFCLRPLISLLIIGLSSTAFYLYLELIIKPGKIQPINYAVFILLLVGSAIVRYRVTVNSIRQRLRVEELNMQLEEIAKHDGLTRLKNRHSLSLAIPTYVGEDICISMLDINKFKFFNDTYGHKNGDEVLCTVADLLSKFLEGDDVYRYGGDEFLIVSRGSEKSEFEEKLEACNRTLGDYSVNKGRPQLGFSYGIVRLTASDANDIHDAISKADLLLYENKKKAR